MSLIQTLVFALIQGVTELFPISSVGHAVLLPWVLHWPNLNKSATFLPYLVMLHVGTAVALIIFFIKDWLTFLVSVFSPKKGNPKKVKIARKEFELLIVGTLPAVVIGGLGADSLAKLFATPRVAMSFLIVNGVILIVGDRLLKRTGNKEIADLTYGQTIVVGIMESLALIPGFSRSAMTMIGSLYYGLRYESAARFSFLLATPVIVGAAVLELPKMHHAGSMLTMGIVGGVVAGVAAYLSTWFLMRYFKRHEIKALRPFGIYCVAIGVIAWVISFFIGG